MSVAVNVPDDLDRARVASLWEAIFAAVETWVAQNGGAVDSRVLVAALLCDACGIIQGTPDEMRAAMAEEAVHMLMHNSGADARDVFNAHRKRHEAGYELLGLVAARKGVMAATIEISPIEVLALKKLVLINGALAKSLQDGGARREQTALLGVLIEVVNRADLANYMPKARSITARMRWEGGAAGKWKLLWASSDLDGNPAITDGVEFDFVAEVVGSEPETERAGRK